jgi:hypothetical protein
MEGEQCIKASHTLNAAARHTSTAKHTPVLPEPSCTHTLHIAEDALVQQLAGSCWNSRSRWLNWQTAARNPHLIVPVRLFHEEHNALKRPEQHTCGISRCLEAENALGPLPATALSAYVSCSAGAVKINRVVMSWIKSFPGALFDAIVKSANMPASTRGGAAF